MRSKKNYSCSAIQASKRMSMLKKDIFSWYYTRVIVVPKQYKSIYLYIQALRFAYVQVYILYPALHLIYLLSIHSKNQSICKLFSHYIDYSEKFASYTITICIWWRINSISSIYIHIFLYTHQLTS